MKTFRALLHREFLNHTAKNPSYSLRAFAKRLSVSHATMSGYLSGKRTITPDTIRRLGGALGLGPNEMKAYLPTSPSARSFAALPEDTFAAMSEWYYDAILELSALPGKPLTAERAAKALGLKPLAARLAIETLVRVGLLAPDTKGRLVMSTRDTTNDLDPETSSVAKRRYQKSIMLKSLEALETIGRDKRDHTSTTMAIRAADLPEFRERIRAFRQELNAFARAGEDQADQVYQLQVSFFPLTADEEFK